jgi:hypothetical protein
MITERIANFFMTGVSWLLLKTIANHSVKAGISFKANSKVGDSLFTKGSQENEGSSLDLLPTSNESRHAFRVAASLL